MALFKSALITQASGSIFGMTFSRNKGGNYIRQRQIPVNPNSPQQQAVRGVLGDLANHWVNTLTAAQRTAWTDYAANVPIVNRLGDPQLIPPLSQYVRSNTPRVQAGQARIDAGPTDFTLGGYTNPSFGVDATADEVDVTFDDGDAWANEDDAIALVYCSRPQNASINYFKGPYRFAGVIAGDSTTPPTSPAAIALPFAAVAGQLVFVKWSVSRADGRLSQVFRGFGIAA